MTIGLTYNNDLSRVQIELSDRPDGAVHIERSTNQLFWLTVRGGLQLPVSGGMANLDDFEFVPDIENFYRVTQTSTEDNVDIFTADGTWNKPPGLVAAKVTVVGAGGGGGSASTTGAGQGSLGTGGGGGATVIAVIPAADLGATETVTVGTGGAGGTAGGDGSIGGTSTFTRTTGTDVTANAGGGGFTAGATSGSSVRFAGSGGTSGAGGDLTLPGEYGENGYIANGHANICNGGSSVYGRGGRGNSEGTGVSGVFGGGGGGTRNGASQGLNRAGGDGGNGLVIVEHIFAD